RLVSPQKLRHMALAVRRYDGDDRRLAQEIERARDDVAVRGNNQPRCRPFSRLLITAAIRTGGDTSEAFDAHERRLHFSCCDAEGLRSKKDAFTWRCRILSRRQPTRDCYKDANNAEHEELLLIRHRRDPHADQLVLAFDVDSDLFAHGERLHDSTEVPGVTNDL